jgi:hypothetical protein
MQIKAVRGEVSAVMLNNVMQIEIRINVVIKSTVEIKNI